MRDPEDLGKLRRGQPERATRPLDGGSIGEKRGLQEGLLLVAS
jgi:hypothetical protein